MRSYKPLLFLSRNGWEWLPNEREMLSTTTDYDQYKCTILGSCYSSTIVAIVSSRPDHLSLTGHYGVLWLEAIYECQRDGCLSFEDMQDMQAAIIFAEENLLKIGMPFTKDYDFHGEDVDRKKEENEKLREELGLEELEKEG